MSKLLHYFLGQSTWEDIKEESESVYKFVPSSAAILILE